MQRDVPVHKLNLTDLNMYQCGMQNCDPGHSYGPAVRDHYLIHYISSGCGSFHVGEKSYFLRKGQGFLILPDIITFYQADFQDPWTYTWVGFNGLKAESYLKAAGLTAENPVFTCENDDYIQQCFHDMFETKKLQKGREIRLMGHLYLFLSQLMESNDGKRFTDDGSNRVDSYVRGAVEFIAKNYSRKISITEIAHHIGLDRSYLGSVFSRHTGLSLQEYLINYRMDKACELMDSMDLAIGDVSRSVGYDDPLLFSKIFKKYKDCSPKDYRNNSKSKITS